MDCAGTLEKNAAVNREVMAVCLRHRRRRVPVRARMLFRVSGGRVAAPPGERFALQEKLQRRCERRYERDNANDEEAEPDLVHSRQ